MRPDTAEDVDPINENDRPIDQTTILQSDNNELPPFSEPQAIEGTANIEAKGQDQTFANILAPNESVQPIDQTSIEQFDTNKPLDSLEQRAIEGTANIEAEEQAQAFIGTSAPDENIQLLDQPTRVQSTTNEPLSCSEEQVKEGAANVEAEGQDQSFVNASAPITDHKNTDTEFPAIIHPPFARSQIHDMKIGVAFDYMRVKVGEIAHLEKFTPALRELYKDVDEDVKESKEAFSDNVTEVLPSKGASQADKARKGQLKAEKKKRNAEAKWEGEKAMRGQLEASGDAAKDTLSAEGASAELPDTLTGLLRGKDEIDTHPTETPATVSVERTFTHSEEVTGDARGAEAFSTNV